MPENNKVMFNGQTVMDISDSTTNSNNLLSGEIGYAGDGSRVVGTATKGHVIKNPAGTALTQRDNLQFKDAHLSDDSTNLATKVEVVKEVTTAQFANETEQGLYRIIDKPDSVINAEQVAYGNGNVGSALDSIVGSIGSLKFETTTASFVFNNSENSNFTPITDFTDIASNKVQWINFFGTGGQLVFYSDSNLYNFGARILSGAFTGTINAKVLIAYTD